LTYLDSAGFSLFPVGPFFSLFIIYPSPCPSRAVLPRRPSLSLPSSPGGAAENSPGQTQCRPG
jgi:hypothetical protein